MDYQHQVRSTTQQDVLFQLPRTSLGSVPEVVSGYDFPTLPHLEQPKIIDIGANTGVFVVACLERWRGARIMSFEPHPETFKLLKNNVSGLPVEVHNMAVVGWDRPLFLHEGKSNRLCCSLYDVGDQDMDRGVTVQGHLAQELPPCDVLKIDTEGAEVEILDGYRHLDKVKVLLLEIHGASMDAVLKEAERVSSYAFKAGLNQIDQRGNVLRYARHV